MIPGHPDFKMSKAGVAHTRSVAFIKKHLGGPFFDLEKIWDEHTYFEFEDRSVEKTMATMVQEPYVNHVPSVIPTIQHLNSSAGRSVQIELSTSSFFASLM
jgi:carboxymethylenebutenolidase